jgi:hypothetical protein
MCIQLKQNKRNFKVLRLYLICSYQYPPVGGHATVALMTGYAVPEAGPPLAESPSDGKEHFKTISWR